MATNHKPRIKGSDNGIWRRIKLIPFNVTISAQKRDPDLGSKLCSEADGIFLWLLQGYQFYKSEGLTEPQCIINANTEYRTQMDSVSAFINDVCTIDKKLITPHKTLYEAYSKWCNENDEHTISSKVFSIKLSELGYIRQNLNAIRSWLGLGV